MKHQPTIFIKVLLFLLVFTCLNCEKEEISKIELEDATILKSEIRTKFIEQVTINAIPNVGNYLKKNIKQENLAQVMYRESEQSFGEIDYSKILMLTDENGQITYTFRLTKPDEILLEEFYFDNLIVKVTEENQYEVYILRYIPDEYTLNNLSFNDFKGEIEHYPVSKSFIDSDFVEDNLLNKEDCRMITITDCGLSGHHSSLSDPDCDSNVLIVTILVECAGVSETINSGAYTAPGSTSGPGGGSGVGGPGGGSSTPVISPYDEVDLARIDTVDKKLSLSISERNLLYNRYDVAMSIYSFLEANFFSNESIAFADEVVVALMEDGEVDWEEQIIKDKSFKDTKADCVYEKFQEKSSGFEELLNEFRTGDPVSLDLKFVVESIPPGDYDSESNGTTSPPENGIITITINKDNLPARTELGLARTLIHEVIHADIHRTLINIRNNGISYGNLTNTEVNQLIDNNSFPDLFEAIQNHGVLGYHHDYMAQKYIEVMAAALKAYDNGAHTDQFYEDLSWSGLRDTQIFRDKGYNEIDRIEKVWNNHKNTGNKNCN